MFRSWLHKSFSKSQREEAEIFLLSLKGANAEVLENVASRTILTGAIYLQQQNLDLYCLAEWIEDRPSFILHLGKEIKLFQKEGRPDRAVGHIVWLHTARAAAFPELKLYAREIWSQFDRYDVAASAYEMVKKMEGKTELVINYSPGKRPLDFEALR